MFVIVIVIEILFVFLYTHHSRNPLLLTVLSG